MDTIATIRHRIYCLKERWVIFFVGQELTHPYGKTAQKQASGKYKKPAPDTGTGS